MSPDAGQTALRLAQQIDASGPITVAEFMQVANSVYYAGTDPFGIDGDFITAPEISQMFGEMVGIWLSDMWLRAGNLGNCHYVELGPGRGTLAADALRTMRRFGWEPQVHFVENSPALRIKQAEATPLATFHAGLESLPTDGPICVIANEFFDALPINQLISTQSGWRERVLIRDAGCGFAAAPGQHSTDELIPNYFRSAAMGSIYEYCPDATSIMNALAKQLAQLGGVMLVIDYGYTRPALGSTLQAVRNHQYADPFTDPGQVDLTAHVDFFNLANCAAGDGLRVSGPINQGEWLKALGIDQRTQSLISANPDRATDMLAARNRLVQPDAMGTLFKVLAIHSESWPQPDGFGL